MSSLCFSDEHLAWQQRVQKEMSTATNFANFYESTRLPSNYRGSYVTEPVRPKKVTLNSMDFAGKNIMGESKICAELRGKYARAPEFRPRPTSCKNVEAPVILQDSSPVRPAKHISLLEQRRQAKRKNNSMSPSNRSDAFEQDVQELTRLLKIERVKKLIAQKLYSTL